MLNWTTWLFVVLLGAECVLPAKADNNLSNHKLSGLIQWKYEKRPFCNAFTGCGKKRASYQPYPILKRTEYDEKGLGNADEMTEGLSDLIDINAEPAVENVQKQIMSQAKIFEAIKEASKEIFRQKNKQKYRNQPEKYEDRENL